jgi:hypothetical protein
VTLFSQQAIISVNAEKLCNDTPVGITLFSISCLQFYANDLLALAVSLNCQTFYSGFYEDCNFFCLDSFETDKT